MVMKSVHCSIMIKLMVHTPLQAEKSMHNVFNPFVAGWMLRVWMWYVVFSPYSKISVMKIGKYFRSIVRFLLMFLYLY